MMYEGGIRLGEVLGIKLCDIDAQVSNILIIPRQNLPNEVHVKNSAGGVIHYPDYVIDEMIDYLVNELASIETDFLFVNLYRGQIGQPLKEGTVEKKFSVLSNELGVHLTPHMLRHGFATERHDNGVPDETLQRLMRHKSFSSTQIYTHVTDKQKIEAVNKFYESKGISCKSLCEIEEV